MKQAHWALLFITYSLLGARLLMAEGENQPWLNFGTIPLSKPSDNPLAEPILIPEESPSSTVSALNLLQQGNLAESQQQLLTAREDYRRALAQNPDDSMLREQYAWFLYSNGYHDKECLRLLEASLRGGTASNPGGIFNAIVEIRDELDLPSIPLKEPPGISKPPRKNFPPLTAKGSFGAEVPGKKVTKADLDPVEVHKHWTFIPSYNTTFFNKGRQNWNEEDVQLYYQVDRRLTLGAEIDMLQRPPSGANNYYSGMASYYLTRYLEVHGKISICPNPTFLATQVYSGGLIYQALPRLGVLLDYQRYNFIQGPIDQISPGLVYNFTDETYLMGRYSRGWAFYNLEYNYYSTALGLALPGKRKLILAFAYGTDPDAEVGANGTGVTTLSPAYTYSVFVNQPLSRDMNLFAGVAYVYRENVNGAPLYEQLTTTIGCSVKF